MGGPHSIPYNQLARDIWFWCQDRDLWLTMTHLPGRENTEADKASRIFHDDGEWSLQITNK